jgi:large subunit ribosomal protein L24
MKIKKDDQVLITSGKDKGKKGKVLEVFPRENKVVVEGVNIAKKHYRPRQQGEKGQMIEKPQPIDVSNIKLICPKCGYPSRVGYRINGEAKERICKKCGQAI